jgi:hypothetical protein
MRIWYVDRTDKQSLKNLGTTGKRERRKIEKRKKKIG